MCSVIIDVVFCIAVISVFVSYPVLAALGYALSALDNTKYNPNEQRDVDAMYAALHNYTD